VAKEGKHPPNKGRSPCKPWGYSQDRDSSPSPPREGKQLADE